MTRWLVDNFVVLFLGQEIHSFGNGYSNAVWLRGVGLTYSRGSPGLIRPGIGVHPSDRM